MSCIRSTTPVLATPRNCRGPRPMSNALIVPSKLRGCEAVRVRGVLTSCCPQIEMTTAASRAGRSGRDMRNARENCRGVLRIVHEKTANQSTRPAGSQYQRRHGASTAHRRCGRGASRRRRDRESALEILNRARNAGDGYSHDTPSWRNRKRTGAGQRTLRRRPGAARTLLKRAGLIPPTPTAPSPARVLGDQSCRVAPAHP